MGMCSTGKKNGSENYIQSKVRNNYKSTVLTSKNEKRTFQQHVLSKVSIKVSNSMFDLKLIFNASQSNFSAQAFHEATNNVKNTIFIARTQKDRIFGAYTPCTWKKDVMYSYEVDQLQQGFLFYFSCSKIKCQIEQNKQTQSGEGQIVCKKLKIKDKQKAIMNNASNGPIFGQGHDIFISDKCHINRNWCNPGKTYQSIHPFGSVKSNTLLAGQSQFLIKEYEIWTIIV